MITLSVFCLFSLLYVACFKNKSTGLNVPFQKSHCYLLIIVTTHIALLKNRLHYFGMLQVGWSGNL